MSYIIFSGFLVLVLYLQLKLLKGLWEKEQAPKWSTYAAGVFSWMLMGSLALMLYGFLIVLLSFSILSAFVVTAAGFIAYLNTISPEFLDLPHMVPFIRKTLLFENIARKRLHLSEELDKFEVRKTHREITGKQLQVEEKPKPRFQRSQEDIRREVEQLQQRKIVTPHLKDELSALNRNEVVDISDSWRINTLRSAAHLLYDRVRTVQIDPTQRMLSLHIDFGDLESEPLRRTVGVFQFYQDLYDFLQAMSTQEWMKPYCSFFDVVALSASRTEVDEFARLYAVPFFRLMMPMTELRSRAGKFFNPAELPRIASVQFNNGDAIEG